MPAAPVLNLANPLFQLNELPGVTGDTTLHVAPQKTATLVDDNEPDYVQSQTLVPNSPPNLPGDHEAFLFYFFDDDSVPKVTGTVDFDYEVVDEDLDFLREGQVVTQDLVYRLTDNDDGGKFDEITITVKITGANDIPTARVDKQTVSENTTFVVNRVVGNDTDPDIGDTLVLTPAGFKVKSVTNTSGEQFLTKAMVRIEQINFADPDNTAAAKDAILVELAQAFQGLRKGEKATVVIEYGITDDFGGLSASTFTITVNGDTDKQIVGNKNNNKFLIGESDKDEIFGLAGNDIIDGRGGNDILFGGAGADKLKGGKGIDTASYETSKKGVKANLLNPKGNTNDAKGDTYGSIENLTGTNKVDVLTGNKGANHIKGLFGNDTLNGGGGADILEGGLGADILNGGGGKDTLLFRAAQDSLPAKKFMDTVLGFSRKQGDKFDLRGVDAIAKTKKDNKFDFIGNDAFSKTAGELRLDKTKSQTLVLGDTNGDGFQDFAFVVKTPAKLVEGDFLL